MNTAFAVRLALRIPIAVLGLAWAAAAVGAKGAFRADPATYDIVRIAMEAGEIPPDLPILEYSNAVDYGHTNPGGSDFLLPQSAAFRLAKFSSEDSRNHVEFTHCHLYGAQSSISFGDRQGVPLFGTRSLPGVGSFFVQARRLDLPPGFRMTWKTRALVP